MWTRSKARQKRREELKKKMEKFQSQRIDNRLEKNFFKKNKPMTPIERKKKEKEEDINDASALGKLAGRDCSKGKIQYEKDNPGVVTAFGQPIVHKASLPALDRPTCTNCCNDALKAQHYIDSDKINKFKRACYVTCRIESNATRVNTAEKVKERKSIMERKRSRQMTPSALNTLIGREQFANLVLQKKKENENNVFDETKEVLRKLKRTGTPNNNRTKVGLPPPNPETPNKNYHLKF